ncbi:MAG: hypothetical protein EAX95_11050 [Candidatus Thorarchaeota archaeon]|nr:hypothetical protein [Candidatus Thorarchaeota archaeon]
MTIDEYERLAATLNKIPNGFSPVEDGTHLRILRWIFTPEEANIAGQMKLRGETSEELAKRLRMPVEELENRLHDMERKGQIFVLESDGFKRYALTVFIGGIWEGQMDRMDEDFARMVDEYFTKGKNKGLFDTEPPIFKVIPINKTISTEIEVYPYEVAEEIIEKARSWGVRECMCKKQKGLLDEKCKYPSSVCLLFSSRPNAYQKDELTTTISKEESLRILHEAEEAGLVHCAMNVKHGHSYICNCCTCCCVMLTGMVKLGQPHAFLRSNFTIEVDEGRCIGCGDCIDRCQFDVLKLQGEICQANQVKCVGCGVCTISCAVGALSLVPRPPEERTIPPEDRSGWMKEKARARGLELSELL